RLFNTIAEGFGKRKPYRKATPLLGELAWRLEKAKYLFTDGKPLLTKESARIAQSKTLFDSSALLTALPHFSFTPLEEVIYNACAAYKEALKHGTLAL
ncbi:MAG: 3-beta hydroxysteroid dehydrogenase, partial [Bacteroidota bacterium]|nr:3-beta hydroxysteroid dehydrogenase [Bacteroidota bacterium]